MSLMVYNTLSRKKEEFVPLHPPQVNMYVCGVTVYDYCHLGHARAAIVFDMIFRYLTDRGYQVKYVRNFTDVDDKIIDRAKKNNEDPKQLAERYIQAFNEDMSRLGLHSPSVEPRATEHIASMIRLIADLMAKGFAYQVGANVFYRVRKKIDYGKLSQKNIEELESGARVEVFEEKEDPLDFALWKAAKPGEPAWASPWGMGRPGWHIECSAMSIEHLGPSLDIHGGGRDLMFPHHENEIAQSEGATGKTFVRYWLHNGFVNIDAEKMSKSLGNFLTIRELLEKYDPQVIRFFVLSSHYRSPLDYSEKNMLDAESAVGRVYLGLKRLAEASAAKNTQDLLDLVLKAESRVVEAMDDDFNTALALAQLFELVREVNKVLDAQKSLSQASQAAFFKLILWFQNVMGLFIHPPKIYFQNQRRKALMTKGLAEDDILKRIAARMEARCKKDFACADQIRQELKALGIVLEDKPDGQTEWYFE